MIILCNFGFYKENENQRLLLFCKCESVLLCMFCNRSFLFSFSLSWNKPFSNDLATMLWYKLLLKMFLFWNAFLHSYFENSFFKYYFKNHFSLPFWKFIFPHPIFPEPIFQHLSFPEDISPNHFLESIFPSPFFQNLFPSYLFPKPIPLLFF